MSPAYEGWWPNEDGSFTHVLRVHELELAAGVRHSRSAPTTTSSREGPIKDSRPIFSRGATRFCSRFACPKDFGTKELIWTLTANGQDGARLRVAQERLPDRQAGDLHRSGRRPRQPARRASHQHPAGAQGRRRQAPERESGRTADAGGVCQRSRQPARQTSAGGSRAQPAGGAAPPACRREGQPAPQLRRRSRRTGRPSSLAARSGPGLRLSWIVYRGKAATVTFSPDQMKTWMDTRVYANSPWSPPYLIPEPPPDGKWVVQATFQRAGNLCAPRRCQRRLVVHLRKRHGHRHTLSWSKTRRSGLLSADLIRSAPHWRNSQDRPQRPL